jgi:hypothetical protein
MRMTFRIDDELLRRTRLYASAKGTTVNQILLKHLTEIANGEREPYPARAKTAWAKKVNDNG